MKDRAKTTQLDAHKVPVLEHLVEYFERKTRGKWKWSAEMSALGYFTAFFERYDIVLVSDLTIDLQVRYNEQRRAELICSGHSASNGTIEWELLALRAAVRDVWKRGV